MHSWSPAGFGQPFGSQPTFQPAGVTKHCGLPAWAGARSLPALPPGHGGYIMAWLPSPALRPEQRGTGHLPGHQDT